MMMKMMATIPVGFRSPQSHNRSFSLFSPLRRLSISFPNNHRFLFHAPCGHIFSGGGNGSNGCGRFGGGSDGEGDKGGRKNNNRCGFRLPSFSEDEYYFSTGTPGSIIRFKDLDSYNEYVAHYYSDSPWIALCVTYYLIAIGVLSRMIEAENLKTANEMKQDHSIRGNE